MKFSNGQIWTIKTRITCNSHNVIYFLICNFCKTTTYCGKTNNLRLRMNGHKSSCMSGKSTDIFDNHVFQCKGYTKPQGPLFEIYVLMELNDAERLLAYESLFHSKSIDTMNKPQA